MGLLSCATTLHPVTVQDTSPALAFLRDGETTEAQVVERLGLTPMRRFPDGVVIYRLAIEKGQWRYCVMDGCYDLVLVFDASGILRVHSLLRVR